MKTLLSVFLLTMSLNSFALQKQKNAADALQRAEAEEAWRIAQEAENANIGLDLKTAFEDTTIKLKKKIKKACFKKGTLILTEGGQYQPIEKVKIGDFVSSFDEEFKKISLKQVKHIFHIATDAIIELRFEGGQIIETTEDHLFYTEFGQIPAGELLVGDLIHTNKDMVRIEEISSQILNEPIIVYDISVEANHNYFVIGSQIGGGNESGVLVHNCDSPTGEFMRGVGIGAIERIPVPQSGIETPPGS